MLDKKRKVGIQNGIDVQNDKGKGMKNYTLLGLLGAGEQNFMDYKNHNIKVISAA